MRVLIIGGGIVGLATAWRLLQKQPGLKVVILEKEVCAGAHRSTHNSGGAGGRAQGERDS